LISTVGQSLVQLALPMSPDDQNLLHPNFVASMLGSCVMMIGTVSYFVGIAMCCMAPDARAHRLALTTIIAFVVLFILAMVFGLAMGFVVAGQGQNFAAGQNIDWIALLKSSGGTFIILGGLIVVLALIGYIAWYLFHAAVASAFQDEPLRRFALLNLVLWLPLTALTIVESLCPASTIGLDELGKARLQGGTGVVVCSIIYGFYLTLCSRTIARIQAGISIADPPEPMTRND
jgi:hypothetical protein